MDKRRERGLKQLPDGRWQFSWCFEGRYHRRIAKTKSEARAYLEKIHTQIREGRYMDRRKEVKSHFEKAVERFLEWSKVNKRPDTYRNDRYFAARWLASPHFARKRLDRITPGDVEAYRTARAQEMQGGQVTSRKTVDNDLARLKRLFSLCIVWGLCKDNPARPIKLFRPESRRDRFLDPEEEAILLEQCADSIRPAVVFSIHTGLRQGEMLSLTWGDVDLKRGRFGYVTVTAEKAKGKKTRHVPMDHTARTALDTLPRNVKPEALVFERFGGTYNSVLRKAWETALRASGLEGVVWHTLRHTFASRLVMAGVPLTTVQYLLGHATLDMVLRYAHLAPGHLEDAVMVLDGNLQFSCDAVQSGVGNRPS